MSYSTDLYPVGAQRTVTAAGTREPLLQGPANTVRVRAVTITALKTNTGNIFVGDSTVAAATTSYILGPGENIKMSVSLDEWNHGLSINLLKTYIDAAVSGEGVSIAYVRE